MSKPVRNPISSFSLNIFNKTDTVSEYAWVSVTKITIEQCLTKSRKLFPSSGGCEDQHGGTGTTAGGGLSIGVMVDRQLWMRSHVADGAMDSSGLLYRATSFVPKGSILMISPNVLPLGVSFREVSWGAGL